MKIDRQIAKYHNKIFVADLHADTLMWMAPTAYDMLERHRPLLPLSPIRNHIDIPRMKEGGVNLQAFGIVTNYWFNKKKTADKQLKQLDDLVKKSKDLEWALTGEDAEKIWKSGKIGVFAGMEGAHPLEGKIENLEHFYNKGVRYLGLAHFKNTEAAPSSTSLNGANKPLSPFGEELISAMDELGIIIDLAHAGYRSFIEAAEYTSNPVIVSHTGVCGRYESKRNINDEQIRAVAKTGGVIGVMFHPFFLNGKLRGSVDDVIDHMDHIRGLVGPDHISLGSDFDGFITLPREMRDVSDLPAITQRLYERGYSEEDIKKVMGGNFLKVYKQVCR